MPATLPKLEEMSDILDLKGMELWDVTWVWIGISLIFILIGLWAFFVLYQRRMRNRTTVITPKTPLENALDRLQGLVQRGLIEGGQVREFYFVLSEVFREFLEMELNIHAIEATLEELRPDIRSSTDLTQAEIKDALWLMDTCEMAKFAQVVPPRDEILKSVKICRVLMTTLAERRAYIPEEPQAEASGVG